MAATRALFGGAISAIIPSTMRDESTMLPIPDHQEVFLDPRTGQGFIVEVVEHSPGTAEDVCRLYVDDLGQLNDATSTRDFVCETSEGLEATVALGQRCSAQPSGFAGSRSLTCRCTMDLPKEGKGVSFRILVLQLPEHGTDVLCVLKCGLEEDEDEIRWRRFVESFDILDFGLFGE